MPRRAGFWLVLSAGLLGCTGIGVRPVAEPDILDSANANIVGTDELSPRSLQTLRRWDLEPVYHHSAAEAFQHLQTITDDDPRPELLFAAAELAYQLGRHAEKHTPAEGCSFYYLCAGYAFHYLFDASPESASSPEPMQAARFKTVETDAPFDPRFRLACDLYNAGLAKCLRAGGLGLRGSERFSVYTTDGKGIALPCQYNGFAWDPAHFGAFQFCSDFRVDGLENQYRTYGLGVPLIGSWSEDASAAAVFRFNAFKGVPSTSFPATAFFRFEGSVADLSAHRAGRLELYNPLNSQAVTVNGRHVPLETDLTTPLAYLLAHTGLDDAAYQGFLKPGKAEAYSGIYAFEPYQRGKIPVLMVHGLLSSPLTWAPMFNDLRADPVLREHFQFWFYLYPTGNPYLEAAAELRQALAKVCQEVDPQGTDTALRHMVLVGHSMGGLVSHLLTVDSGDDFWHLVSHEPFAQLKLPPQGRAELEPLFYFTRQPTVERVVFIATPHRGSKLSPSAPGRLAADLVDLPKTLRHAAGDLARDNPSLGKQKLPTSVELLAPNAPALLLLVSRPRPADVHFHSILGQAPPHDVLVEIDAVLGQKEVRGDGAVPYSSAHLDDVDSELVVEADHNHVHQHPRAVAEVRRILLEHWHEQTARIAGVAAN